jgi:PPP family 3-phenylpropionic acid transporter
MSSPVRLGLFYSAVFIGIGASAPYIPVWFRHLGLSGAEIGLVLAAPMLARVVTAPGIALWADGFALRRTALIWLGAVGATAYVLLAAPFGFWWWFVIWFAAASVVTTISPLADVIVLARARREGFNYGWPRGIGSAAFIVANVGMGVLLTKGSPSLVLVWIASAAALAALSAALLLPPDPVHATSERPRLGARLAGLVDLLRDPVFMTVVVSAGLIQSSHAYYYAFSVLAWRGQGLPASLTGVLWGVGVAAEIAFMWFMEPWRRRVGPRRLLVLGGAAAVARWTAFAFSPPLWLLFPLQTLHTFSFAATFLAVLQLVERLSTPTNASAAQTISSALSGGVLSGLATLASGWLFDRTGGLGYLSMAAMSAAGLAGALSLSLSRRLNA